MRQSYIRPDCCIFTSISTFFLKTSNNVIIAAFHAQPRLESPQNAQGVFYGQGGAIFNRGDIVVDGDAVVYDNSASVCDYSRPLQPFADSITETNMV